MDLWFNTDSMIKEPNKNCSVSVNILHTGTKIKMDCLFLGMKVCFR